MIVEILVIFTMGIIWIFSGPSQDFVLDFHRHPKTSAGKGSRRCWVPILRSCPIQMFLGGHLWFDWPVSPKWRLRFMVLVR